MASLLHKTSVYPTNAGLGAGLHGTPKEHVVGYMVEIYSACMDWGNAVKEIVHWLSLASLIDK